MEFSIHLVSDFSIPGLHLQPSTYNMGLRKGQRTELAGANVPRNGGLQQRSGALKKCHIHLSQKSAVGF